MSARPYSVAWWAAMVAVSLASAAVIVATEPAHAQDKWTGPDKVKHVAGSAAVGVYVGNCVIVAKSITCRLEF